MKETFKFNYWFKKFKPFAVVTRHVYLVAKLSFSFCPDSLLLPIHSAKMFRKYNYKNNYPTLKYTETIIKCVACSVIILSYSRVQEYNIGYAILL